ncbi:MAG TPA: imidazole glycerol phosphate synthase subunit HisH [Acidimicrobiia bacterium]|nr:imidazole glycerol phosphate synthase subunit HisH [Acidimicrobiia bacterium]
MSDVKIVPTGTANIASVRAALTRLGASVSDAGTGRDVTLAAGVVLPGVGAFGAAMTRVGDQGLASALRERIEEGRSTLVVCVGMQLLCRVSEESPGAKGLGILDATVTRFGDEVRVPQLGWNQVDPASASRFVEPGWAYFANSYRIDRVPDGWAGATTEYGGGFVSALERGNVLACQFHPELSGPWGASLLGRWLETAEEAA